MESSALAPVQLELKPTKANYWKRTAIAGAILTPFVLLQALRDRGGWYWILVAIVVAISVAGASLYLGRARLVITPTHVGTRGMFGFRWIPRESLDRLLVVRGFRLPLDRTGVRTDAFLFDRSGKRVLRINGQIWDESFVQQFDQALAIPTAVRQGPNSPRDVAAIEPKALNWSETHTLAVFFIALGAGLAAVVLTIVITLLVISVSR